MLSGDQTSSSTPTFDPFLTDILPHTIIKRHQIEVALEFQERFESGKFTVWNKIPDEEIDIRNSYRIRLKELK